jgi:hypothetical protein
MRMGGAALAIALAAQFVLLGCVAQTSDHTGSKARLGTRGQGSAGLGFAKNWYEVALPNGGDHNHRDLSQHLNLSTPNFGILGWNPLVDDYHGKAAGGYFCGDVSNKAGRRLAVVHSWVSDIAFILMDVTDPSNPQKLSEVAMANTHVYDLAITPDQHYVLLATTPETKGYDPGKGPGPFEARMHATSRDGCTGQQRVMEGPEEGLPYSAGILLVDISNPRVPAIKDFVVFPILGGHSVTAAEVGGKTLLIATVENIPGQTSYYVLMGILETAAGGKFDTYSIYQRPLGSPQDEAQRALWSNHDAYIQKHPVTGQTLAYLADGQDGLIILNVDDPRMPKMIGAWSDWDQVGGRHASHYIHETFPITGVWDGRHYTFMGEECLSRPPGTPSCLVYAMDTTDPTKPTIAGVWTFPHDPGPWSYPTFSTHYMATVNRTLFVSSFHAGVWAIDLSTADKIKTMPSVGVFLPDKTPPKGFAVDNPYHRFPETADVIATGDGNLLTFDATSGAYVIHFDAANPAPSPTPWPVPGTRSSLT